MQQQTTAASTSTGELQREVARLIVEGLNLDTKAEDIAPDAALYGEGLGLDSIDMLEIAMIISKRYGLQLKAENADNRQVFTSLRSLSDYIAAQRTL